MYIFLINFNYFLYFSIVQPNIEKKSFYLIFFSWYIPNITLSFNCLYIKYNNLKLKYTNNSKLIYMIYICYEL